jgi:hypothetical protein
MVLGHHSYGALTTSPALTVTMCTADQPIVSSHITTSTLKRVGRYAKPSHTSCPRTPTHRSSYSGYQTASFWPIKGLQDIAAVIVIEAACSVPLGEAIVDPPIVTALGDIAQRKAILDWEQVWLGEACVSVFVTLAG